VTIQYLPPVETTSCIDWNGIKVEWVFTIPCFFYYRTGCPEWRCAQRNHSKDYRRHLQLHLPDGRGVRVSHKGCATYACSIRPIYHFFFQRMNKFFNNSFDIKLIMYIDSTNTYKCTNASNCVQLHLLYNFFHNVQINQFSFLSSRYNCFFCVSLNKFFFFNHCLNTIHVLLTVWSCIHCRCHILKSTWTRSGTCLMVKLSLSLTVVYVMGRRGGGAASLCWSSLSLD